MDYPSAEIEIDVAMVQGLLRSQCPHFSHLPIYPVNAGWDNQLFRLGDALSVRLPRRQAAATLIETEQTWLPLLAPRLPLAIPTPFHCGKPNEKYPWAWSVLPWIQGSCASVEPPTAGEGKRFAKFLNALHQPPPNDIPFNPFRSVSLTSRSEKINLWIQQLSETTGLITPTIKILWKRALDADTNSHKLKKWIHGDLHPRNILTHQGKISGVIDWGDTTAGDPAVDLATVWMTFPQQSERQQILQHYQVSGETQALEYRAKGWAIFFAAVFLTHGAKNDLAQAEMGRRIFQNLEQDGL